MPDIEAIIEAILRGRYKDDYDKMSKLDLWSAKQAILEQLIPALGVIEEMKARVWDEGVAAIISDNFLDIPEDKMPRNPYRTGIA